MKYCRICLYLVFSFGIMLNSHFVVYADEDSDYSTEGQVGFYGTYESLSPEEATDDNTPSGTVVVSDLNGEKDNVTNDSILPSTGEKISWIFPYIGVLCILIGIYIGIYFLKFGRNKK